MTAPILEVSGLARAFGGIRAVDGVDLRFAEPGIVGLIGPNGAGKTTLFDLITGRQSADSGEIRFEGRRIDGLPVHRRARLGFARTFQECRVLVEESCLDNLLFAAQDQRLGGALGRVFSGRRSAGREALEDAWRLLEMVNLPQFAHRPAGDLSYGQRRLLEIASTLMARPGVLLLDEPAAGVNPSLLNTVHDVLLRVAAERRILLVVVEHNMPFIMSLAAHVVVLHQGRVLEQGSPAAVQNSPRVVEAYLG
ncbi:ABC transporter ATP-binding protein [Roseomonas sp. BN140053]|uniref:ABC transporter ATP-binding protein n=1 Tax=Roseomonas sp. BN140053 TaxID=3391898 RepID=UPI0039E7E884